MDSINMVTHFIHDLVEDPERYPAKTFPLVTELLDNKVKSAIKTLRDVEEVCEVKLEDVKVDVLLASTAFKNKKYFPSFDRIIDAKAKFETKICTTGV